MPTLTLCKASWKTTDVGVVSGNTGVNAQPVWSQMQLLFGSYGLAYAEMAVFGCFFGSFFGVFCHFFTRWSKIKVLEPMDQVGASLWMKFQEWRKKNYFFGMISSKNRPKGAFLATYLT